MRKFTALALALTICFILLRTNARSQAKNLVTYKILSPEAVMKGKPFLLTLELETQPGWYVYAPTGNNTAQGMIETKITFTLPSGIIRSGKMVVPEPIYKNGFEVLEGKIPMSQSLTVSLEPGNYAIKGKITWQTCSANSCLPPVTEDFVTSITVR